MWEKTGMKALKYLKMNEPTPAEAYHSGGWQVEGESLTRRTADHCIPGRANNWNR